MDRFKRALIGIGTAPAVVAATRAVALYLLPVLAGLLIGYLNSLTDPRYYALVALLTPFIRAVVEAIIDQVKRPAPLSDAPPIP